MILVPAWLAGRRFITVTDQHHPEKCNILFSRLENPPSTLFSSSIEFSTMEVILLYSASIAMSHSTTENCTAVFAVQFLDRRHERFSDWQVCPVSAREVRDQAETRQRPELCLNKVLPCISILSLYCVSAGRKKSNLTPHLSAASFLSSS